MKFFRKLSIAAYFLGGIISPLLFFIIFGTGISLAVVLSFLLKDTFFSTLAFLIGLPLSIILSAFFSEYLYKSANRFYKNNGGTISLAKLGCIARIWYVVFFIFGVLWSCGIAIDQSVEMKDPPSSRAKSTIYSIVKTCTLKEVNGEVNPIFNNPKLNQYLITPSDGNCDGDENNLLTAMSQKPSKYPTYIFNMKTKEKTCSHDGPNEELHGCSAKSGGKW